MALHVFLVASAVPDPGQHATHMVLYETLRGMAERGHRVALQVLVQTAETLSAEAQDQLVRLARIPNVTVLAPLSVDVTAPRGALARRLTSARRAVAPRVQDLYSHARLRPEIERRIAQTGAEVVVNVWSMEGLAASCAIVGIPKYAYYAMPEYLAPEARLRHPWLFDIPTASLGDRARLCLARRLNWCRERFHFAMMRAYDAVANICAFHADLYARRGHPRATYLPNMWPDRYGDGWRALREANEGCDGEKVVGSVGNVFATGNTFGLYYLGTKVLPALARHLGQHEVAIHVYGRGRPYSQVAAALADPRVRLRGWVPDIDAEILSAKVFLVLNNAGYYRGVHTRFLHAWELGACVVAHAANREGMPEIRHGENALLGGSPDEIAELLAQALKDPALRRRIGEGGRRTFERQFRSDVVVPRLLDGVHGCLAERVTSPAPATLEHTLGEAVHLGGRGNEGGHGR